jgi:hypothetical protein
MTSPADKARAKAKRIAAVPQRSGADTAEESAPPMARVGVAPPVSSKPIRVSLDLAPALFDQLTAWRTHAARTLGQGRVTNADALRVLVRRLVADADLSAVVIEALRRERTDR